VISQEKEVVSEEKKSEEEKKDEEFNTQTYNLIISSFIKIFFKMRNGQ
jgi:hypothetical protein